ncbi:4-hydroxythreonine-4-phosphate dehydrogenase PdxA [Microvirga sp. BT689]|uniref:PdxA family dehydrogenase n=1 Tax=Microvirga arvi TaxID=2778731 RepID=UPI0019529891|nr:4-hydroxythreonine-4-phosphate dehydrogenase PdxA [Microvirga arvi]MBM6583698.1 4-hydroxythreonine-4-phosphate dehydrogenase PdxA [Microvirga arvi]
MATLDADRQILPRIALLLGDCTGIGPELCARVLSDGRLSDAGRLVVVGDVRVLEQGMRDAGVSLSWHAVSSVDEIDWSRPDVPIIDLKNTDPAGLPRGAMSAESGRLTGETLADAVAMTRRGKVDAITFAPLNKAALYAGGWRFPDEHKMFAHLLEHRGYFSEMNVLDNQWMSRVTSHVSLRQALDQITSQSITDAIGLADRTMRRAGFARPRLAVAALNPHAGEGGLFGSEEIEIITPAVAAAAESGIDCRGPFPADTVYLKAFAGEYDGVVAMYHDQGQIATKLRGFNRGVTVTAGLEAVFTTPAHGTAFDIVGKGVASTGALENAVRLAAKLAGGGTVRSAM